MLRPMPRDDLREAVTAISEREKTELLTRLIEGDSHVAAELKSKVSDKRDVRSALHRTAGALRMRAAEIREAREKAIAKRQERERQRQAAEAERARRARLEALKQRSPRVWQEIEAEIERRNPSGYERAIALLSDLQALAVEEQNEADFNRRFAEIRHEGTRKKGRFIERLSKLGPSNEENASGLFRDTGS